MEPTELEIVDRFTYHPPRPNQPEVYEAIRAQARDFALMIARTTPTSREQSLALTHLEQTVMFANAAVARHG